MPHQHPRSPAAGVFGSLGQGSCRHWGVPHVAVGCVMPAPRPSLAHFVDLSPPFRSSRRTNLAGLPATSVRGSTSRVTTAPAATVEPSPMVTPAGMHTSQRCQPCGTAATMLKRLVRRTHNHSVQEFHDSCSACWGMQASVRMGLVWGCSCCAPLHSMRPWQYGPADCALLQRKPTFCPA